MDVKSEKSEDFAVNIVTLYEYLTTEKREFVISKQILRSGTSIGANIAEANYAESKSDFIHKMSIAQKECSETMYWLRLLSRKSIIDSTAFNSYYTDASEIMRIITVIIKTAKSNP